MARQCLVDIMQLNSLFFKVIEAIHFKRFFKPKLARQTTCNVSKMSKELGRTLN